MPKKAEKKKKEWREGCRAKVKSGMINLPDGTWKAGSGRMWEMMRAGYKLG